MSSRISSLLLAVAGIASTFAGSQALAQSDMTGCKGSVMDALSGKAPMPPPMPMPAMKAHEPMPTAMAPDTAKKGDVGAMAAVQDKCLDALLSKEQADMDKKK